MSRTQDAPCAPGPSLTRRNFVKTTVMLAGLPRIMPAVFAAGSDRIKIGLVGCGGRGIDAVRNCIAADPAVQLHAIGDLFADRVASALGRVKAKVDAIDPSRPREPVKDDRLAVTTERSFVGFDAYRQVIESGVDIVLLATPPQLRLFATEVHERWAKLMAPLMESGPDGMPDVKIMDNIWELDLTVTPPCVR